MIKGLNINTNNTQYTAFFCQADGSIRNLSLQGNVVGSDVTGAFVARGSVSMDNLTNFCHVTGGTTSAAFVAYGNGTMKNLTNYGRIYGSSCAGSIVGSTYDDVKLTNCENYASVKSGGISGGLVGKIIYDCDREEKIATISQCANTGDITGSSYAGGIIGYAEVDGDLLNYHPHLRTYYAKVAATQCANTGSVNSKGVAAGIFGYSKIYDSYGRISINSAYNTGNVTGASTYGLACGDGYSTTTKTYNPTAYDCYNVGLVTNTNNSGVINTTLSDSFKASRIYYLLNTNREVSNHASAIGNSVEMMRIAAGYEGFDFTDTWTWDPTEVYEYPILCSLGVIVEGCKHVPGKTIVENEIAPTCKEEGSYEEITYCFVCQNEIKRRIVTVEKEETHTEVQDLAIAPTCAETGLTEGIHCKICGEVLVAQKTIPALGHDWDDGIITEAPTYTAPGTVIFTCIRDSSHTKKEAIPQLEVPVLEPVTLQMKGITSLENTAPEAIYVLSAENMSGLSSVTVSIAIDEHFFVVTNVQDLDDWTIQDHRYEDGCLTVSLSHEQGVSGSGNLLKVSLKPTGTTGETTVAISKAELCVIIDVAEFCVNSLYGGLSVEIDRNLYDINSDGIVSLLDLTRAQRFYGTAEALADINCDQIVDVADLLLILCNLLSLAE